MKTLVPLLIVVVVCVALWFAVSSSDRPADTASTGGAGQAKNAARDALRVDTINKINSGQVRDGAAADSTDLSVDGLESSDFEDFDQRTAVEVYKSAEDALKAVREGSSDYDDLILDQFTEIPDNCPWCDSFFASVKDMMMAPTTDANQRSYYAELLAVSGRLDNVKTLVESIKNAPNQELADIFAEALELAVGKDDVVRYLGEQLATANDTLRESSVAAITNQGSRLALETLYNHTTQKGDPDGYYSMGIGIGEVVPDEDAYPYLQELVLKRDQYSHLAVKALLNSGLDGLKVVVDSLAKSKNPDSDRALLKDAIDHVSYDDDVIAYLRTVADKPNEPLLSSWAKEVLKDFEESESEAESLGGQIPLVTPQP